MNAAIRHVFREELISRGFTPTGVSPNDTMTLTDEYLEEIDFAELFESMVARREKVFHSAETVGQDASRKSYEDVVLVIHALAAVMRHFLPS